MTKRGNILIFAVVAVMLLAAACSKPRIIPDDRLAQIFHDVYLTNAYVETNPVPLDSLNIYEPLFARYGYTTEDVQFTIGNFAKRKSARLSDVVEKAITMIETESNFYSGRIAMADTLKQIAGERYATTVHTDSVIRVRRIADTARLRISIPVKPGSYDISYSYFIDSVDHNSLRPSRFYLLDSTGRERNIETRRPRNFERERVSLRIAADSLHRSLVLDLNGYPDKEMTAPDLRIDSLVVKYYIPDRAALDSMARSLFDYRVLDSLSRPYETHLVPPLADTLGTASR